MKAVYTLSCINPMASLPEIQRSIEKYLGGDLQESVLQMPKEEEKF